MHRLSARRLLLARTLLFALTESEGSVLIALNNPTQPLHPLPPPQEGRRAHGAAGDDGAGGGARGGAEGGGAAGRERRQVGPQGGGDGVAMTITLFD